MTRRVSLSEDIKHAFIKQLTDQFGIDDFLTKYLNKKQINRKDILKLRELYNSWDPYYDESIPKLEIAETMKQKGWQYSTHSVRAIFKKNGYVAKVATDSCGIAQNYLEVLFYKRELEKIKLDKNRPKKLFFPKLYNWDNNYIWLIFQEIKGRRPNVNPSIIFERKKMSPLKREIDDLRNYLWCKSKLDDINIHNIIVKGKGNRRKHYVIDCGFYGNEKLRELL